MARFSVFSSPAMPLRLGKVIVNTYVLSMISYAYPVWVCVAACHRKTFQGVLDRGLKLASKVPAGSLLGP